MFLEVFEEISHALILISLEAGNVIPDTILNLLKLSQFGLLLLVTFLPGLNFAEG